jgi:hypothetical protein
MPRFTVDLRFVEIEAELWALSEFLRVIESQVQYLIAQDEVRMRAQLHEQGLPWEDPDVQLAFQEHDARTQRVFPRFMRAPFLVALCASYEAAIEELANAHAKATKRSLLLQDIRARSWFDAARKYFDAVLLVPMDENAERLTAIRDLFVVRNAIAHANGQIRSVPTSKLKRLEEVIRQHSGGISIDDGLVTVESSFLEEAFANVNGSVRALVDKVRGGPAVRRVPSLHGA